MEKTIKCLQCPNLFTSTKINHKFCSYKCAQKYHNSKRLYTPIINKICKHCQISFSTNKSFKIFCSDKCKTKYFSLLQAKHPQYNLVCPNCKNSFIAKRSDKIFCSRECLCKYRRDRIPRKTSKSYFKANELRSKHIPQNQLEIIYGTLLGDASLILQTNNFHRLSLCHCEKQLNYLIFKKEKLKSIFIQKHPNKHVHKPHLFRGCYVSEKVQYHTHSISHKDLTNVYGIFHRNKKKIVTRKALNLLTPTSLLLWYLDDGSLSKQRSIIISSLSFSLSEHKAIKIWFWQKHKIEVKIGLVKNTYNNELKLYYNLRFTVPNTRKFIDLISTSSIFKELPECMLYKVNIRPYKNKNHN